MVYKFQMSCAILKIPQQTLVQSYENTINVRVLINALLVLKSRSKRENFLIDLQNSVSHSNFKQANENRSCESFDECTFSSLHILHFSRQQTSQMDR